MRDIGSDVRRWRVLRSDAFYVLYRCVVEHAIKLRARHMNEFLWHAREQACAKGEEGGVKSINIKGRKHVPRIR